MAPSFVVQIFKHAFNSRPWSNVYLIEAADLLDAQGQADILVAAETQLHNPVVTYDRVRVSSTVALDSVFEVTPLATIGQKPVGSTNYLPLFNAIRVDFHVIGGGRPSRKYYRAPVTEDDNVDGKLTTAALAAWQSLLDTFITSTVGAGVNWVDPQSQVIDAAAVYPDIAMRQLHRKRKRSVA